MDSGLIFTIILVNLALSGVVAYVASERGRSPVGFGVLSFFLSFVLAMLVLIALPRLDAAAPAESDLLAAQCPRCKESIRSDATICKHCQQPVEPTYEAKKAETQKLRDEARQQADALRAQQVATAKQRNKKTWIIAVIATATVAIGIAVVAITNTPQDATNTEATGGGPSIPPPSKELTNARNKCIDFEGLSSENTDMNNFAMPDEDTLQINGKATYRIFDEYFPVSVNRIIECVIERLDAPLAEDIKTQVHYDGFNTTAVIKSENYSYQYRGNNNPNDPMDFTFEIKRIAS